MFFTECAFISILNTILKICISDSSNWKNDSVEIENHYHWLSAQTKLHFLLTSKRLVGIMSYVKVHLCYGVLLLQVMRMYNNGGWYGWGIWAIVIYEDGSSYFLSSSVTVLPLIARFMGPTWDPSGADRTQVGPMLAPWTLLSGQ